MSLFLGVDAGGTKTAFCLVDGTGQVLGTARAGSGYYLDLAGSASREAGGDHPGVAAVAQVLREGLAAVCSAAGVAPGQVDAAVFGLTAYGEVTADVPALDAVGAAVLGHSRYRVVNDVEVGWAGSLGGDDGVNLVAGTGTNSYGVWGGRGARCGGWGELFGDEGSGYWVALRGLRAFTQMSDGRLPVGPLHGLLRAELGLADGDADFDVLDVVLVRWDGDRGRVAALSRVVGAAAAAGDAVAAGILDDAGREVAAHAHALRRVLGVADGARVPVATSGSLATVPRVRSALGDALGDGFVLRPSLLVPEAGAALLAARDAGSPLSPTALSRLAAALPAP